MSRLSSQTSGLSAINFYQLQTKDRALILLEDGRR